MKHLPYPLLLTLLLMFLTPPASAQHPAAPYGRPATGWDRDALEVSGGGITARFLGGIARETVRWSAVPQKKGQPRGGGVPVPGGEITLDFPGFKTAEAYSRWLDTTTHIATTSFCAYGTDMERELFAAGRPRVLVLHLRTAEGSGPLNFTLRLRDSGGAPASVSGRTITCRAADTAYCRETLLYVRTGTEGAAVPDRDGIRVVGAAEATIYLVADARPASPRKGIDRKDRTPSRLHRDLTLRLRAAAMLPYAKLRSRHIRRSTAAGK